MGVFSFLKGVGASVFGGGNNAADVEKLLAENLGNRIQGLKAEVSDAKVALSGICDCLPTKEKAILLSGNVKGIETVDGDKLEVSSAGSAAQQPATAELIENEESRFYEIKSGDTLSKIAKQFYGNANKYPLIFEANREVIKHPDKIYPGQMIRVPKMK